MRRTAKLLFGLIGLGFGTQALANDVRELPFDQKALRADLVVIGQVLSTHQRVTHGVAEGEYAGVQIQNTLKGTAPQNLEVLSKGLISEMNPDCCRIGQTYLFFLVREQSGAYESVNGRFGIYPLFEQRRAL